jgi:hypothetical protein
MKYLIRFFIKTAMYKWLMDHAVPFIRFTTGLPRMSGARFLEGYVKLKPGHIILCVDKRKLSALVVPGEFSHAALVCRNLVGVKNRNFSQSHEIVEMTHTDFTKSYFFDICKESDRVVILECTDFDDSYANAVVAKAEGFDGVKYDDTFELGTEALYCSELIYMSDFDRRLKLSITEDATLGMKYISPDDLYKAENVRVVYDSGY